jgi:hypothetical protein
VQIEPNHWDIVVRGIEKVHEDPLKSRDWQPDPHHWMKDPTLWGRNIPPRFDKEVEVHTYWSGLKFEDKDLILRVGFAQNDEQDVRHLANEDFNPDVPEETPYGPPNKAIAHFHTKASLELYLVTIVEEDPPKFLYLGRDQYSFPDEFIAESSIDRPEEATSSESTKKNVKVVVTKDSNTRGDKTAKDANQGGEAGGRKAPTSGNLGESRVKKDDAAKEVKVTGGDEVALP